MVGCRLFRPKFRTKSRNFPALERDETENVSIFKTKIRLKCFYETDETGPCSLAAVQNVPIIGHLEIAT